MYCRFLDALPYTLDMTLIFLYNALSYLIALYNELYFTRSPSAEDITVKKTTRRLNISILRLLSAYTRHNRPLEMGKSAKVHKRTVRPAPKPSISNPK